LSTQTGMLMEIYDIILLADERYEVPDESNWYQP
jgi:hypothetical protein